MPIQVIPHDNTAWENIMNSFSRAGNAWGDRYQNEQKQKNLVEALKKQDIDPSAANLSKEERALLFKSKFANEKPLNPLQQSRKKLYDEQLNNLKQNEDFYGQLFGNNNQNQENNQNIAKGFNENEQPNQNNNGNQNEQPNESPEKKLAKLPIETLQKLAALKGQPGKGNVVGNLAQSILDKKEYDKKNSPEFIREQELAKTQAADDSKFYKDLNEKRKHQIYKKDSLNRIKNIVKKGVSGKPYENALERMGLISLTSDGRRELSAEVKNQYTDFKQITGSQMSSREFFTLTNAYPNADFSQKANEAIINNLEEAHDLLDKEYEIATRLKKENGGKIPENFQEKVNTELEEYSKKKMEKIRQNLRIIMNEEYGITEGHTLMFDSNGDPLSVPDNEVADLLDKGLADLP